MWQPITKEISPQITQHKILQNGTPISFREWIELTQQSVDFIKLFTDLLASSRFKGFFWEVKPINKNTLANDFEFVLVESTFLSRVNPDKDSFSEYFNSKEIVAFPNLGGDAHLIAPSPIDSSVNYAHLAAFLRTAPKKQVINFWKMVATEFQKQIGTKNKWLSTSGLGVYWLHVRIDSYPKYYQYAPYRMAV